LSPANRPLAAVFVAATAAAAASPASGQGTAEGLQVFGISPGFVLLVLAGMVVIHVVCLGLGAAIAGLPAGLGRSIGVLLAAVGLSLPFGMVQQAGKANLSEETMAVVTTGLVLVAETLAIKWLYRATWSRAILAYLSAGTLTAVGISVLVLVAF
jgi:hypothetical protein